LGPIQLGSRVDDVQSLLGPGKPFTKIVGSPPALMYLELGVAACFDSGGRLTELEAFEPSVVTLSGVKLLGSSLDAILGDLQEAGRTFRRDPDGAESVALGVRLWVPEHLVVSVVVFDPQNPMPVPSVDELLEAVGIAPISRPTKPPHLGRSRASGVSTTDQSVGGR
jgi:hypothetical protein